MSRNSSMMSALSGLSLGSARRRRQRQQTEEPELSFGDLIPALPSNDSDNRRWTFKRYIILCASVAAVLSLLTVSVSVTTVAVKHTAQRITQSVNKSDEVGPCDDFYTYTCQGWLNDNPVVAGAARNSYSLEIRERIEAGLMSFIEGRFSTTV
ncbi:hypothetical protein MTO96_045347 [Rhipicephalus appendiculatus]